MQTPLPARRPLARKLACAGAAPSARAGLFRGAVTASGGRLLAARPSHAKSLPFHEKVCQNLIEIHFAIGLCGWVGG